jgi:PAS domain-containing protein
LLTSFLRFNRASENDKDPQTSKSPKTHLPSGERREGTSIHSQPIESTDKKSVYRPPWLPKAEDAPASVFDLLIEPLVELNTSEHAAQANLKRIADRKHGGEQAMEEDTLSYDLRPPPVPKRYSLGIENTVDLLYGEPHLQSILKDKKLRGEFVTFLAQRMPSQMVHMIRLSDNEKAIAAITYANAIAQAQRPMTGSQHPAVAAIISEQFQQDGQRTFGMLLAEALPAYIAHVLTNEVMRYMEKQIPRMRTSHMDQQPVKGISEVFCLTDPNMKDHPIIYASKEFFRLTQYGRDYAIGRNCRFLQGPKTASDSVFRLGRAIRDGREVCETILNYRRDGTPFLNLLLMAPLRDDRGNIKASSRSRS